MSTATTLLTPLKDGMVYALVGNPNCGKTTLFNALTGLKQRVGNYPGVTVERKEGECFSQHGVRLRVIDLPGAYSLNARSPDEAILRDVLLGRRKDTPRPDRIVCVIDASNLERNLYLFTQILELGVPAILVLNMVDVMESTGIRLDVERLSEKFGVPVIPMIASQKKGLVELKLAMSRPDLAAPKPLLDAMPVPVRGALVRSRENLAESGVVSATASPLEPLYLISGHDPTHYGIEPKAVAIIEHAREQLEREIPGWEDRLVASRYDAIHAALKDVIRRPDTASATFTDKLDTLLLHKVWGWLALAGTLAFLFYLIFSVVEIPVGWIEDGFAWVTAKVNGWMSEGDLRGLITDGVLSGVSGVLVFLPQILILFFFIGFMEDTGYMARVAFLMDRVMSRVGLTGKSFLPLLGSHACAVPGIMATRTIESPRDRLITILVSPLAACSARLPVYILLIAALVPGQVAPPMMKAGILLALYALGIIGAFVFAWLFNKKLLPGKPSAMILELPAYKMPSFANIVRQMVTRAWMFVRRAGTVILGLSILLWAASTYPKLKNADGSYSEDKAAALAHSTAGRLGHAIEPVVKPMGADWKVGIGLIASFAAREVFNSTLSIIYSVEDGDDDDENITRLRDRLAEEKRPDGTPMYTPALCFALMVFFVFAMQCLSTVAVVRRETHGWKWPLFQLAYMTGTGYLLAIAVFQIGRLLGA
ncbi:MAG TPA: ferrous iron transport protein B [Verrucomicrobiales bacterium]|nr:ferrous iron transport protein B [Verrucomicrobiales bacterium]